ncbi:lysyl-tRNA synthetase [Gonapodya prolifera JEL478]|uniref:Lysine--tRNA ligase n=1 Tax=Gonapodya prolifera (strain JEL478) TaxID=1344416 RepID=A0A139AYR9_GONPJ|nr:lysyl-tRNA synthetase [Gonapodya prolifera JEL478]|eukprot:KXS21869.1 lysyl-tRNA synthetase [Gonapodya prolifera JEL478]
MRRFAIKLSKSPTIVRCWTGGGLRYSSSAIDRARALHFGSNHAPFPSRLSRRNFATISSATKIPSNSELTSPGEEAFVRERRVTFQRYNVNPYPHFDTSKLETFLHLSDFRERFERKYENGNRDPSIVVTVVGRVTAKRVAGKASMFLDITRDGHRLQVISNSKSYDDAEEHAKWANVLLTGDIIEVTGFPGSTRTNELSIIATRMNLLAPCLRRIPKTQGLEDAELRLRIRPLALLASADLSNNLRLRSRIVSYMRRYFDTEGFLEVETPVLSLKAGGANAKPFVTWNNGLDAEMRMRVAPELYLKQLVVGGLDRVYEIGKCFRNEGIDNTHLPEFTSCEFYEAYADLNKVMTRTEKLLHGLVQEVTGSAEVAADFEDLSSPKINFTPPFRRIHVVDTLSAAIGEPLPLPSESCTESKTLSLLIPILDRHHVALPKPLTLARVYDKLIERFIEHDCFQPTFLVGHPGVMCPLARRDPTLPATTLRFELFVKGFELANAYAELNDPLEQHTRFVAQFAARTTNPGSTSIVEQDEEVAPPDEDFVRALEYGLPPTGGWGLGIDRLVMILTGAKGIRDVVTFAAVRPVLRQQIQQ